MDCVTLFDWLPIFLYGVGIGGFGACAILAFLIEKN